MEITGLDKGEMEDEVIHLLGRWNAGDRQALPELTSIVYRELYRLASSYVHQSRPGRSLRAIALVQEAFARLAGPSLPTFDERYFYIISARIVRQILVEQAKARKTLSPDKLQQH